MMYTAERYCLAMPSPKIDFAWHEVYIIFPA